MEILFQFLGALGALLTAFFMYPSFCATALTFKASAEPVSPEKSSDVPGDGFFRLEICFGEIKFPVGLKSIEVSGCEIPKDLCDAVGNFTGGTVKRMGKGSSKFPVMLGSEASKKMLCIIVKPLSAGDQIQTVTIRYGLFRRSKAKVLFSTSEQIRPIDVFEEQSAREEIRCRIAGR